MSKTYEDLELKCGDCGATFIFTAGEQEFYDQKGFTAPKRCNECRTAIKNRKKQQRSRY